MIDLVHLPNMCLNGLQYSGCIPKMGVTSNGDNYIVKMHNNSLEIFSELLVSTIIADLGFNVQQTHLGFLNNRLVCFVRDFVNYDAGEKLIAFNSVGQSSENTDIAKDYTYLNIEHLIDQHNKLNNLNKQIAINSFWDIFILDSIFANRDRHSENWGYLYLDNQARIAPIFDNGGSLFPDVFKIIKKYSVDRYSFIEDRVAWFPASLMKEFKDGRCRRTNYNEIMHGDKYAALSQRIQVFKAQVSFKYFKSVVLKVVTQFYDLAIKENLLSYILLDLSYKDFSDLCEFYALIMMARFLQMLTDLEFSEIYAVCTQDSEFIELERHIYGDCVSTESTNLFGGD